MLIRNKAVMARCDRVFMPPFTHRQTPAASCDGQCLSGSDNRWGGDNQRFPDEPMRELVKLRARHGFRTSSFAADQMRGAAIFPLLK